MIPKNLKVGDTFEDCGLTYKVLKVVGENYESQMVNEPCGFSNATKPEEPKAEATESEYDSMLYSQLKKLCAERGLDAKGSKADLIARLEG